jgi:hypothetical protein
MPELGPDARQSAALGTLTYLGTIDYTDTSKTNATATTPFGTGTGELSHKTLLIQPSTAVHILTGTAPTAASTTSVKIGADERVAVHMGAHTKLAAIRSASSGNLLVWELT